MVDWSTLLLIFIAISTIAVYWLRRTYAYWWARRIKFIQPVPFLGNLKELFNLKSSFAAQLCNVYFEKRFANEPAVGLYFFHKPCLLIRDLELARTILIKDFSSFSNRYATCDPHNDKMGSLNLFFVKNPEWRDIRTKLAPVFTSGKLKQFYPLMQEIGYELESHLSALNYDTASNAIVAEVAEICALFTTDMIATIAFGRRANSLRDPHTEFRTMFTFSLKRTFDYFVVCFAPQLVQIFRSKLYTKKHAEFLRRTIHEVIEEREHSGQERNDLIDILLTLKKEAALNADETHFAHNLDYLVAQAAVFEVAGFETSSMTMAFALYELAKNPEVQSRLRAEISAAFADSQTAISYEKLYEMSYLDMVLDETLRLYPVVPFLDRECTPLNSRRRYSMKPFLELNIPKRMPVFISNLAIQRDPKYWPEPEKFDPERFSSENKQSHTPMSYMPFGMGPHSCIGMRTGLVQVKIGLVHFLRTHRVDVCEQTPASIDFDPRSVLLSSKGGIHLKITRCV